MPAGDRPVPSSVQPVRTFDPELLLKAQDVRLLLLDVDGVLTDGGLHFTDSGEAIKRFHVQDGLGLAMLRRAGLEVQVISGRDSAALRARLRELGVSDARLGVPDKLQAALRLLEQRGLPWSQVAAIGDDWPDLAVLGRCGLSAAPADAHEEVRARVDLVTPRAGGQGAVRDLCDLLLAARGAYARLFAEAAG